MQRSTYQYSIIVLSIVGMIVMSYLSVLHFQGGDSSFCDISNEVSCSVVNKSTYSEVAGIPVSFLGIFYFAAMFALALRTTPPYAFMFFLTLFVLLPSLYLTFIEIAVIKSICVFCELAKALMIAILGILYAALRKTNTHLSQKAIMLVVLLGLGAAGATFLLQRSPTVAENYNTFAQCLTEKGFRMYGSVTCAACARQRTMFGDAFQYIQEIECDPRNPHPETERCIAKNIQKTPTWIQEDENGNEIYRFSPGIQKLQNLSDRSECPIQ